MQAFLPWHAILEKKNEFNCLRCYLITSVTQEREPSDPFVSPSRPLRPFQPNKLREAANNAIAWSRYPCRTFRGL